MTSSLRAVQIQAWFLPALILLIVWLVRRRPRTWLHEGYVQRKDSEGNVQFEHRMIAELILRRKLNLDEVVHHVNGRRHDNRPKNLCVMTNKNHQRYHDWYDWIYQTYGNFPRRETQLDKLRTSFDGILLEDYVYTSRPRSNLRFRQSLRSLKRIIRFLR